MLFKYAGNIENVSYGKNESIMQFGDSAEISEWAYDAISWAVTNGIINGTDEGLLMPKSELTRSQLAQLMTNFMKNCEDFINYLVNNVEDVSVKLPKKGLDTFVKFLSKLSCNF